MNYNYPILGIFLLIASMSWPALVIAQDEQEEIPGTDEIVIEPQIERGEVKLPRIDTEDFEAGIFTGIYALEDFGSDVVFGVTLAYHISEDLFVETAAGLSTVSDSSFRGIGLPVLPNEEDDLTYYNISIGYNALPGELFFITGHAITTQLYFIGGIGNTEIANEDHSTFNYGLGLRMIFNDWAALRLDFRDHVYDTDLLGRNKTTHNTDVHIGLSVFF